MKTVLTCRLSSGETVELCPIGFKWADFKGAEILGGEQYYIDKALSLGATQEAKKDVKPKRKTKGA